MNDINQSNFLELGSVRHIQSEQEALEIAKEVANQLNQFARDPSYNKTVPYDQARLISEAGLSVATINGPL